MDKVVAQPNKEAGKVTTRYIVSILLCLLHLEAIPEDNNQVQTESDVYNADLPVLIKM